MSRKRKDVSTLFELIAANRDKVKGLGDIPRHESPVLKTPAQDEAAPTEIEIVDEPVAEVPVETPAPEEEPSRGTPGPAETVAGKTAPAETAEDLTSTEKTDQDTPKPAPSRKKTIRKTVAPTPVLIEVAEPKADPAESPDAPMPGDEEPSTVMAFLTNMVHKWRDLPSSNRSLIILSIGAVVLAALIGFYVGRGAKPKPIPIPTEPTSVMIDRSGAMVEVGKYYLTLANFPATDQGREDAETFQSFAKYNGYNATVNSYLLSDGQVGGYLVWSVQPFSTEVGEAMQFMKDVEVLQRDFQETQNRVYDFRKPRFLEQTGN